MASSWALNPISPMRALWRSFSVTDMKMTSLFQRSISCRRTMNVGAITSLCRRLIACRSKGLGTLSNRSAATLLTKSSLLISPPPPPTLG